jgi:hypothetical protein
MGDIPDYQPTSEFILKRILRNDMQNTPGWKLNPEMRTEFPEMLRDREQSKGRGRL